MNTRRQHYIAQSYLDAWTVDGKLYCLRDGKVFGTTTKNVGQQRDFYRLRELTDADIVFIKKMVEPMPDHLRANADKLIRQFTMLFQLRKAVEAVTPWKAEAELVFEAAINNMEEQMHGQVESSGIPFVKAMRAGDTSFLAAEDGSPGFYYFLSLQSLRTKRTREQLLKAQREVALSAFERTWNVLTHIFATSIGWSLYSDRRNLRIVLLKNPTDVPLITSDQPLINLLGNRDGTPPEKLAWYYPVSPQIAMVLTEPPHLYDADRLDMGLDDVHRFNALMRQEAHEQLYSASRDQLEAMIAGSP